MKNKLWKEWMMSGALVSAMFISGVLTVKVQAKTTEVKKTAETENTTEADYSSEIEAEGDKFEASFMMHTQEELSQ